MLVQWGWQQYCQKDPRTGILRPISYFSTTLNGSQRRYSAGQTEAWALVSATRKWYDYLRAATHVYLITDHIPLLWMKKQKDPRNTFARWIMELEDLDYEVVYRKGSDNTVADTLSRGTNFYDEKVNCENTFEDRVYVLSGDPEWINELRSAQENDEAIKRAKEQFKQGGICSGKFKSYRDMNITDDMLCRGRQVAVPNALKGKVISMVHGHPTME